MIVRHALGRLLVLAPVLLPLGALIVWARDLTWRAAVQFLVKAALVLLGISACVEWGLWLLNG